MEIVAILAAGLWAYNKFLSTEAPALKRNTRMESTLTWKALEGDPRCLAQVSVQVTNRSKSEITVGKVVRRAWFVAHPMTDRGIIYFDAMDPEPPNPIDKKTYLKGPLAFSYPPDAVNHHTFSWFVENKADSIALFRIELYENEKATEALDFIYEWGRPCEFESPQKKER